MKMFLFCCHKLKDFKNKSKICAMIVIIKIKKATKRGSLRANHECSDWGLTGGGGVLRWHLCDPL
jgi:hypothetical protein